MWKFIAVIIAVLSIAPALAGRGGSPLQNGFNGAPSGATPLASGLFTNGTGGDGTNYLGTGGVRPPWAVAGVDYGVGFSIASNIAAGCPPNGCNPAIVANPGPQISAGCGATVNTSTHDLQIASAPCTIQNLDLSVANGYKISISSGCTGGTVTFTNNNVVVGSNHGNNDLAGSGILNAPVGNACNLDIENNVFDGNGCNFGGAGASTLGTIIGIAGAAISVTAQYNQLLNSSQHGIALNTGGSWNVVIRYNYLRDFAYSNNAHGDPALNNGASGKILNLNYSYNVIMQPTPNGQAGGDSSANGNCAANAAMGTGDAGTSAVSYWVANSGVSHNNISVDHNILITLNNTGGSQFNQFSQSPPLGIAYYPWIHDNYLDGTGSTSSIGVFCFAASDPLCLQGGGIFPIINGNVLLTNGHACSQASCS